jgi:hypothetical protein
MAASKRPSFLKRQKEQQRLARANEKREARRAKKHAKTGGAEAQAEAEDREGLDSPLEGMGELPSDLNGEDVR